MTEYNRVITSYNDSALRTLHIYMAVHFTQNHCRFFIAFPLAVHLHGSALHAEPLSLLYRLPLAVHYRWTHDKQLSQFTLDSWLLSISPWQTLYIYICAVMLLNTNYIQNTLPGIYCKEPFDGCKTHIITDTCIAYQVLSLPTLPSTWVASMNSISENDAYALRIVASWEKMPSTLFSLSQNTSTVNVGSQRRSSMTA